MPAQTEVATKLKTLFVKSASKRVSKTDKSKSAYVLTRQQVGVLEAAGLKLTNSPKTIEVQLIGETPDHVKASYYLSVRAGADRAPEPRMGRDFISIWLECDDEVTIATDGVSLFAFRTNQVQCEPAPELLVRSATKRISDQRLQEMLPKPGAGVPRVSVSRSEFVRSPAVVELALRRSEGECEFPGCKTPLFRTSEGRPYLEVHHINWLRNGGLDSLENVVALCPRCHRALHSAAERQVLNAEMEAHLSSIRSDHRY